MFDQFFKKINLIFNPFSKKMFGRFNERAQKVLSIAKEEAVRLGHDYIDTEHILLGLLGEGGIAVRALVMLGMEPKNIQKAVEDMTTKGLGQSIHIGYTLGAKKVIELSLDEARKLGHKYVNPGHILLGLIRENEGVAARVLNKFGVSLDKARQQLFEE